MFNCNDIQRLPGVEVGAIRCCGQITLSDGPLFEGARARPTCPRRIWACRLVTWRRRLPKWQGLLTAARWFICGCPSCLLPTIPCRPSLTTGSLLPPTHSGSHTNHSSIVTLDILDHRRSHNNSNDHSKHTPQHPRRTRSRPTTTNNLPRTRTHHDPRRLQRHRRSHGDTNATATQQSTAHH
jgi:hypothetical protein